MSRFAFSVLLIHLSLAGTLIASDSSGQAKSMSETIISIHVENESLEKVLKEIQSQTNFHFSYYLDDIKEKTVTVHARRKSLMSVLKNISGQANLSFRRIDGNINVQRPEFDAVVKEVYNSEQQGREINGTVTSRDDGSGLPGVNVVIKGTSLGTITDLDGNFKITVPSPDAILVFSFIGYVTEEVPVGEQATINMTLVPDVTALDEIVVVGYGTQRKESVTGSVASVRSEELTVAPIANTTNALAGRLPGLVSQQTSGQPGADAANLSIRGFGDALVIVDGVQMDFKFLDPNQIESITILKDASASIYGSRAGNGVILVTTKRGVEGKPQFTFNTSQTLQSITTMPRPVNAGQYAELAREEHINSGLPEATAPFTLEQIQKYKEGNDPLYPNTDWYDELIRQWSPQQQHNLSVRGGNDAIKYYGFLGYLDQETVFKKGGGGYKRYNFQSNIDAKILDNLDFKLTLGSIIEDRNFPHTSFSTGEATVWNFLWNTLPIYPASLPDPTKIPFADGNGTGGAHVVSNRDISGYNDRDDQDLRGSLALDYDFTFIEGLSAKAFMNYHSWNVTNRIFIKPVDLYTYDPTSDVYTLAGSYYDRASLSVRHDKGRILTGQLSLSYDRTFAEDHHVTALALYEVIDYKSDYVQARRENFMTPALDQLYAGGPSNQIADGRASENSRTSYVGRLNYSFREKYLIETIIRADATPVFPAETRWGYFPSVSLGWRLSEEGFIRSLGFIDDLKLRASYGQSGNDYASNNIYRYLSGYSLTIYPYILGNVNEKGFVSIGLPNPNITWENVTTYNVGLDFALFRGKLYGEADAFYREVTDILGTRSGSVPSTFGATLPLENINSSNDRGFELKLGTSGQVNELEWDLSGNISWSRSKWDHYDEPEYTDPDQERLYKRSGRWKDRQIGYLTDGLFTSTEEITGSDVIQDNNGNTTLRPGDVHIVDTNGDNIIDWRDQVEIGKGTVPHWMAGFNATLRYKNFDFSALLQGAFGYNTYITYAQGNAYPVFLYEERWTESNNDRDALVPRLGSTGGGYNLATTSMRYKDAGYVRLKTMSLGYNLPGKWLDKINIDQVRLYVAGTNLLTLDKLKKFNVDPETPSFNSDGSLASHTGRYYPQQKTISLGASISF